jgi:membrane protease YdiL (CAAX protease family)
VSGPAPAGADAADAADAGAPKLARRSDPWTDLALTLPIFVAYHLGVIFLPVRNAADPVTAELRALAKHSLPAYVALTLSIGAAFVAVLWTAGRKQALEPRRFVLVGLEGALYAFLMRLAGGFVVGSLRLAATAAGTEGSVFSSVVMALGAGFYEEVAFRVTIFGVGSALLRRFFKLTGVGAFLVTAVWGLVEAVAFSAWHYTGALGDQPDLSSFVFRAVCGLVLTAIFAFRGFAPAVWTHALYDVWVMVFE